MTRRTALAALLLPTLAAGAAAPAGGQLFTEEAAAAGIDFVHFNGMSGELYFVENMGAGAGLLDYDGDGDLDVYLVQGTMLGSGKEVDEATFPPAHPLPLSDRLYRNDLGVRPDGTRALRFTDVTESSGLAALATGYGMGVAAGDYDRDGFVDLYVTNFGANQLLRNRGDGTFEDATGASGTADSRWSVSASFFDYDRDGWSDLYVANYVDFSLARHHRCHDAAGAPDYCGPLAYEPVPDQLFRNRGDGTFEDVSAAAGILAARGTGLGVVAADFDGDGWSDLYVANDQMPNFLWINQRDGTFREDAVLAGCALNREGKVEASMGVLAEDFDGDGDQDLFMTHLAGETHTLYVNDGRGLFHDRTVQSGLGPATYRATGFGTGLLDYDHDGEVDLLVANGAVTLVEELVRRGDPYPMHERNQLFRNLGGLRFREVPVAEAGAALGLSEVSRGVAVGDVDEDGDADALVANNAGPARLLVNRVGQDNPWLALRLRSGPSRALGTAVEIHPAPGVVRWRRVHADGSYVSARDPRVRVGLGASDRVAAVRIHWPGGVEEWRGLPAGRLLVAFDPAEERAP